MFDIKKEAAALVAKMTLEEKLSQMLHAASEIKRLGIPNYNWWSEALHGVARAGVATMFPQAIALAASFDEAFLQKVADCIASEGRAKFSEFQKENDRGIYKGINFWSPNINIFRDPRWGRGHETYGEDPYLTARLGVAFIKGLQGPNRDSLKSAACAKHFAVHSGPEAERHSFNAVCDSYDLWNTYLPAFEAAVKEGEVEVVMGAYNRTLGEPCCGSKFLLQDILRDKWGFDGHVVSDCWAIRDFHETHRVTRDAIESVAMAIRNGCDINCGNLFANGVNAVRKGLVSEERVDEAVTRLFVTRMRLGLLGAPENPEYVSIPYEIVDSDENHALNLEAARRSLVLLKNDGSLPLDPAKIRTVGVIGPNADNRRALEGNYNGTSSRYTTVLQGVRAIAEETGMRVMEAEGCHLYKDHTNIRGELDDRIAEARTVARHADAVIVCLGLDADIEGEQVHEYSMGLAGGDKPHINLPGRQMHLLENIVEAAAGKPVILVLISGSSLAVTWADGHVNGILQVFYPGSCGGTAVAEALFGRISPSGKLPVTFYRSNDGLPDFHDYSMKGRTYRYLTAEPLYSFGFGLSYCDFGLSDLNVSPEACVVTVTNGGKMPAREVVQVYVTSPDQKENSSLCGFAPVFLQPGASERITVRLNKNAFSRYNAEGDPVLVRGVHDLFVGFTQPDPRSVALSGRTPLSAEVEI